MRLRSLFSAPLFGVGAIVLGGASVLAAASGSSASGHDPGVLAAPRPLSILTASTCNGNSCQVLSGSGLTVTNWYAQTTAPNAVCTHATFYDNGTTIAESSSTCLSAGASASALFSNPGKFSAGTRLCTQWSGISGRPCDTIES